MRNFVDRTERLSEKERRNLSILDSIRRNNEISRADISKITDLNIVTVSNYVSKYVKSKLVFETGLDISSGGRRPELLKLNAEYCYTIGVDLGAPHIINDVSSTVVLLDLTGKIVARERRKKEPHESFEKLVSGVIEMMARLIENSGVDASKIYGAGVGIWGVIDRYRGMVRYAVENELIVSYTSLLDQIETRFGIPATIEHDATLAAFGEKWSGIGAISSANNLIFLCSDSSCGMVINGELYYGASKSAGELNISPPRPDSEPDPEKPWTSYSSASCLRSRGLDLGITDRARSFFKENPGRETILFAKAGKNPENITFAMTVDAANEGDEIAKKIVEDAGEYLGAKIAFLINLFNPEVVVVGRSIEKAGDLFFSAVRRSVRRWAYEESVKIVKILPASLGDDSVAVGAGALVAQDFFAKV
ncbi:MAG: ROK family protein [Candidatus Omnitrophica bacterium]|nr:ROK family protein [Candidatus Omnitrophota bacterium]